MSEEETYADRKYACLLAHDQNVQRMIALMKAGRAVEVKVYDREASQMASFSVEQPHESVISAVIYMASEKQKTLTEEAHQAALDLKAKACGLVESIMSGVPITILLLFLLTILPASAQDWVPSSHKVVGLVRAHKYLGLIHTYKYVYKLANTKELLVKPKPIDDVPDLRTDRQKHPWMTTGKDVLMLAVGVWQAVK